MKCNSDYGFYCKLLNKQAKLEYYDECGMPQPTHIAFMCKQTKLHFQLSTRLLLVPDHYAINILRKDLMIVWSISMHVGEIKDTVPQIVFFYYCDKDVSLWTKEHCMSCHGSTGSLSNPCPHRSMREDKMMIVWSIYTGKH